MAATTTGWPRPGTAAVEAYSPRRRAARTRSIGNTPATSGVPIVPSSAIGPAKVAVPLSKSTVGPTWAAPVAGSTTAVKSAAPAGITDVRYRRHGWGPGAVFGGLAAGIIGAGIAATAPRYYYYDDPGYYGGPYAYYGDPYWGGPYPYRYRYHNGW